MNVIRVEVDHDVDIAVPGRVAPGGRAEQPRIRRPVLAQHRLQVGAMRTDELTQNAARFGRSRHALRLVGAVRSGQNQRINAAGQSTRGGIFGAFSVTWSNLPIEESRKPLSFRDITVGLTGFEPATP